MKRLFLFAFLSLWGFCLSSQVVFCPPGATWHYLFENGRWSPGQSNVKIDFIGQTFFNGQMEATLQHELGFAAFNTSSAGYTYIRQTGDTIWFNNSFTNGAWQILYNFNCPVNGSWTTTLSPCGIFTVQTTVIAHSNTVILGQTLKKMTVVLNPPQWPLPDTIDITERFGAEGYMFYFSSPCATDGDWISRALCYRDDAFGPVHFSEFPCDYSNPTSVDEVGLTPVSQLFYPNPATSQITFSLPEAAGQRILEIRDLTGKTVLTEAVTNASTTIDLRTLTAGVYVAQLRGDGLPNALPSKLLITR